MKKETICGTIAACSKVVPFVKKNGTKGVKCVLYIKGLDGQERAVTVTGELTNWSGCIDMLVEVEYIHRVFPLINRGYDWYGNELNALNIKAMM